MKNVLISIEPPKYLISATLLFWGYQSGLLILALCMAFIQHSSLWTSWRLQLVDKDYYKIGNFCTLIFIACVFIVVLGSRPQLVIHQLVNLLPIVFFPLLLAQFYSNMQTIPLGAFIYRYRKNNSQITIKLGYLYFAVCLLAASVVNVQVDRFFMLLIILIGWALWHIKASSVSVSKWLAVFSIIISISYLAQYNLLRAAIHFEQWASEYFTELFTGERDPFRNKTAMGKIGKLKLSNKIVMRVLTKHQQPVLLQEAIYDSFYNNVWFSTQRQFEAIQSNTVNQHQSALMTFHRVTRNYKSLLAVPLLNSKISVARTVKLSRNTHGTIKAVNTNKIFEYSLYNISPTGNQAVSIPSRSDLIIPKPYQKVIADIHSELSLHSLDKKKVIQKVSEYFNRDYRYSLYQEQSKNSQAPLITFLSSKHRGHCEFFASATVLLLRSAEIPTRYVVGYAASEYDKNNEMFIVHARDSHAWAQAYINNKWINIDNTPSVWYQQESVTASIFEPLTDWFSTLYYKFSLWQQHATIQNIHIYNILSALVFLYIILLMHKGKLSGFKNKFSNKTKTESGINTSYTQTAQQELLQIIFQLGGRYGVSRYKHEPLLNWQQRFQKIIKNNQLSASVTEIILLYYQIRFSAETVTKDKINILKLKCDAVVIKINHS